MMLKDIVAVAALDHYQLLLTFEDQLTGTVDLKNMIEFTGVFESLADPEFFKTVKINPEWGTIFWENGADLDPDVLYSQIMNQISQVVTSHETVK